MSNAVESFATLYNNPFILGPLFRPFYEELGEKENSILLSYLVFPLCLNETSRKFLMNANINSSIRTLVKERKRLIGLEERLINYQTLTNTSLQYLIDAESLKLTDNLALILSDTKTDESATDRSLLRASKRLGILFSPYDIPSIYRMLGVKKL